tara:strand:+ start:104 stop:376 length:273 start_codon:yes stop_codon:yes gene_type:complete
MNLQELKLVVTFKKRLLNLEKGYKELSHWHDKNKMQVLETYFSNKKIHEQFIESQKKQTDFQEQVVNSLNNAMQAIVEINERLQRLEEKS